MKQTLKITLAAAAALVFTMETHAATVWLPTDVVAQGDVNVIELPSFGISLNGGTLALFEDTDPLASGAGLVLGGAGGRFEFSDVGSGNYSVEGFVNGASVGSITMNGTEFKLAVDWGGGFVGDDNFAQAGGDNYSYLIDFSDGPNSGSTLAIDLTPVPLPAAAWLFGTAVLGLAAIGRRRAVSTAQF